MATAATRATAATAKRTYRQTARAVATERTAHKILDAAVGLWLERAIDEITLQMIAKRAGVSVQTVIRRFGSKEGVIEACIDSDAAKIIRQRATAPVGDVAGALEVLFDHYEQVGDAVMRTVALQERYHAAKLVADAGRAAHRAWCERVFEPQLASRREGQAGADRHDALVDALVAATDLYVWKLLRRDLGRSRHEAQRAVRALVDGLTRLRE